MAAVRRHWALVAAIPLFFVAILVAILTRDIDYRKARADTNATQPTPSQANPPPSLDTATARLALISYTRTQQLRTELALKSEDLAAMGVSLNSATQILTAVQSFTSTSVESLSGADTACAAAQHTLQDAVRSINTGTGGDTAIASLPTLQQNVASAVAQRANLFTPLVTQINAVLTSDQQTMWQAARDNAAAERMPGATPVPGAFRYVAGLTSDQVQQLDLAARRGGQPGLLAAAPEILNAAQTAAAQTALSNQTMQIAAVSAAEANVLPVPVLLKVQPVLPTQRGTQGTPSPVIPAQ